MKAYLYHEGGVPWQLEEVPDPEPGPGEVLVDVKAAGVCGSDLHYRFGRLQPYTSPLIPGHEIAGVVAALGEGAEGVQVGDRVCVHYIASCGACPNCDAGFDNRCRNRRSVGAHIAGGFAERLCVPSRNAFALPESIPMDQGAIIGCAVSTAYHALQTARIQPGESAVVFGLGGVGLHVVLWAHLLGAAPIVAVDIARPKLELAPAFGADLTLHPEDDDVADTVRSLTAGYGADMAFECSGQPDAMKTAIQCIHGKSAYESGRLISVAALLEPVNLPSPREFREGAFTRSGDHTRQELRRVIQLVAQGRVDLCGSVTHRFGFGELERAMQVIETRQENVVRAVLMAES